jgi:hypothetical protein
MVIETVVEDGRLTRLQLLSMVNSLVEAAEVWQSVMGSRADNAAGMSVGRPRWHGQRRAA